MAQSAFEQPAPPAHAAHTQHQQLIQQFLQANQTQCDRYRTEQQARRIWCRESPFRITAHSCSEGAMNPLAQWLGLPQGVLIHHRTMSQRPVPIEQHPRPQDRQNPKPSIHLLLAHRRADQPKGGCVHRHLIDAIDQIRGRTDALNRRQADTVAVAGCVETTRGALTLYGPTCEMDAHVYAETDETLDALRERIQQRIQEVFPEGMRPPNLLGESTWTAFQEALAALFLANVAHLRHASTPYPHVDEQLIYVGMDLDMLRHMPQALCITPQEINSLKEELLLAAVHVGARAIRRAIQKETAHFVIPIIFAKEVRSKKAQKTILREIETQWHGVRQNGEHSPKSLFWHLTEKRVIIGAGIQEQLDKWNTPCPPWATPERLQDNVIEALRATACTYEADRLFRLQSS